MSLPRIAPVFTFPAEGLSEDVRRRLHALVRGGAFTGSVAGNHMMLTVQEKDRHFWSPWLHLEVSEDGESVEVRGRFTPHPSLWTGFAFCYFSLIVMAGFAVVWGLSQWMIEERPTALWVALGCAVLVGLLWWSAQVGQRLARAQMEALRCAVQGVVGDQ